MQKPVRLMHDNRFFPRLGWVNQLRLLLRLYNQANGNKQRIDFERLIPLEGDENDVFEVASYLEEQGLIVIENSNRRGLQTRRYLRLTRQGIVEVEGHKPHAKEIKHVTKHYYKNCVIHRSVHDFSTTTQNFGAKSAEVLLLIKALRKSFQSLPAHEQPKALKVVDALDKEIRKKHPRRDKLKSFMDELGVLACKTGVETMVRETAKLILGA